MHLLAMPRVQGLLKVLEALKRQVLQWVSKRWAIVEELPNQARPERQELLKLVSRRQKVKQQGKMEMTNLEMGNGCG